MRVVAAGPQLVGTASDAAALQKLLLCVSDVETCRVNVTCNECKNLFEENVK